MVDGRLIAPDAELRALELIDDKSDARFQTVAGRLVHRLADYSDPLLGSAQRRFLMSSLAGRVWSTGTVAQRWSAKTHHDGPENGGSSLHSTAPYGYHDTAHPFPALQDGEDLAAAVLESGTALAGKPVLQPSGVPEVWQFASADWHVVSLLRTETIAGELQTMTAAEGLAAGADIALLPPDRTADTANLLSMLPAGDRLPGWQLALRWNDEALAGQAVHGKIVAYWFVGLLAIAAGAVLAFWIAISLLRQMAAWPGLRTTWLPPCRTN